jgi:hypothetical protein
MYRGKSGRLREGDKTFGFVYSGGTYSTINVPGSLDTFATGINASGEVTGYYYTNSATYGFIATPQSAALSLTPSAVANAPELSTWALLLAGFAGLGFARYCKARNGRRFPPDHRQPRDIWRGASTLRRDPPA